ncbi:MAG: glycosyltransferase family 2 protein [Ruminococcaceae bacterium]|nr:glycosyltransferase family 2 protein [Oscillospiraceae bacterium]
MSNSPKVSIIIPIHNTEKYIRECLDSVINQTLKDIEIICVDDASTDNTPAVLQEYAINDGRVKVFRNEVSKSALGARKKGVLEASGEYIMFLDSDDYYATDACEIAYNKIIEQNVDVAHFSVEVVNCCNVSENRIKSIQEYTKPYIGKLYNKDIFKSCFIDNKYTHTPFNKIYRTELCKKAYLQTEDVHLIFAEDLYVYFIMANNAKSYYGWESKPLYYYCYGRGVTTGDKIYNLQRFEKVCRHAETIKVIEKYCRNNTGNIEKADYLIDRYRTEWLDYSVRIFEKYLQESDKLKGQELLFSYWGKEDVLKAFDINKWHKSRMTIAEKLKFMIDTSIKKGVIYTTQIVFKR